jgi:hypothetical protein
MDHGGRGSAGTFVVDELDALGEIDGWAREYVRATLILGRVR